MGRLRILRVILRSKWYSFQSTKGSDFLIAYLEKTCEVAVTFKVVN